MKYVINITKAATAYGEPQTDWNLLRDMLHEPIATDYEFEDSFTGDIPQLYNVTGRETPNGTEMVITTPEKDINVVTGILTEFQGMIGDRIKLGDYVTVNSQPLADFIIENPHTVTGVRNDDVNTLFTEQVFAFDDVESDEFGINLDEIDEDVECVDGDCQHPLDDIEFNEDYDSIFNEEDDFEDDYDFTDIDEYDDEEPLTITFDEDDVPYEDDYSWESDLNSDELLNESFFAIDKAFGFKNSRRSVVNKKKRRAVNESMNTPTEYFRIKLPALSGYIKQHSYEELCDMFTYPASDVMANYNDEVGFVAKIIEPTKYSFGELRIIPVDYDVLNLSTFAYCLMEMIQAFGRVRPGLGDVIEFVNTSFINGDFAAALADEDYDVFEECMEAGLFSADRAKRNGYLQESRCTVMNKKKGCCGGGKKRRAVNESMNTPTEYFRIKFSRLSGYLRNPGGQEYSYEELCDMFTYPASDVLANYNDEVGFVAKIIEPTKYSEGELRITPVDYDVLNLSTFAYCLMEMIQAFGPNMRPGLGDVVDYIGNSYIGEFAPALANEDYDVFEECVEARLFSTNKVKLTSSFMGESRRSVVNKKKAPQRVSNRLVSLTEALKAFDEKDQKKLDKVVKTVEDVIKAVKGQTIGEAEAREAMKKLKAQQNAIKKIRKSDDANFNLTDIKGVTTAIKKIIAADPKNAEDIKKFRNSLTESVVRALAKKQRSLYTKVSIDKVPVSRIKSSELLEAYKKAKASKQTLTLSLKESVVGTPGYQRIKESLINKDKMMCMIAEELTYRKLAVKVLNKLNEDEEEKKDDAAEGADSMDDLAAMFGTTPEELAGDEPAEDVAPEGEDAGEEVELARVVIQMADKESAEQLFGLCKDAGIPEDAMEIEDGTEESIDEPESDDADGEETEGEEGDEKNESIRYSNIRKLFEAEDEEAAEADEPTEGEDGDADAEGDDTEDAEEAEGDAEVKFILTNTDYVDQLAKVLNDEYGIENDEFEEMIGGSIVSADDDDEESIDEPAEGDDADKKDDAEGEDEDDMSAADIFGNM